MSATLATQMRHKQHKCDTSATRVRQEQHECNTSATGPTRVRHGWKTLILITTLVKTYFHTLTFTIWQVKDYKERNNFILETTFWKCLVSMPNEFKKCTKKTLMVKALSKRCTLDCSCKCPCTFPHSSHSNTASFLIKTILCGNSNILFSKNYWKLRKMNGRFWRTFNKKGR